MVVGRMVEREAPLVGSFEVDPAEPDEPLYP